MDELPDLHQLLKKHSPSHKPENIAHKKKNSKSRSRKKKKKKSARKTTKKTRSHPKKDPIQEMEEEMAKLTVEPATGLPKQAKIISIKEAKMLFGDLPSAHRFWLKSGKPLKNLHELREELKMIGDVLFRHHVTPERNDFANWVRDCMKNKDLAKELYVCSDQKEMIKAIDQYIDRMKNHSPSILPTISLQPDSSFIRFDLKPAKKNSKVLEKDFSIRPVTLKPNFGFIRSGHKKKGGVLDFKFKLDSKTVPEAHLIPSEADKLIQEEVDEREKLREEISRLTEKKEDTEEDLEEIKDEVKQVKKTAPKEIKNLRDEQKDIVKKLKENEIIIKDELSQLKNVEVALEKKKEEIEHRSEEINEVYGLPDNKGGTIAGQVGPEPAGGSADDPGQNGQFTQHVDVTDALSNANDYSGADQKRQERIKLKDVDTIPTPDKEQAKKMMAENKYSPEVFMHIISQARELIKEKKFERAKNMIEELKKHIDKADLNSKQKRTIYYNLLELSTDLELSSM